MRRGGVKGPDADDVVTDGDDPSGVYVYRFQTGDVTRTPVELHASGRGMDVAMDAAISILRLAP